MTPSPSAGPARTGLAASTLAALGVVYGDIGTSPLYTLKAVFDPSNGIPLDTPHIVGACSAIFWTLMVVVTLKYVWLVLRADHQGEGGVLALTALAAQLAGHRPRRRHVLLTLGLLGATLFYGDSLITPAISVLGAVEGLEVATPAFKPYVLPISVAVLVALFAVQRFGTGVVGRAFGPVIVAWFVMLALSGGVHIAGAPQILAALDPREAWRFLQDRGWGLFATMGAVVLAVTGAEALYADMGHFGRRPIRLAWTGLVMPSLALNYLGQGALLIDDPTALDNPFFRLFGSVWLPVAIVLATLAAIIASQAVISGAYSMTRQAIQLGFLPRMALHHTSAAHAGQVYMPAVNTMLLLGVAAVVVGFGSSSALAGAYGIAVTVTMLITTVLTYGVVRHRFRLPAPVAMGATGAFVAIDLLLAASCSVKFMDGGWFTCALGLLLFVLMSTWARGRRQLMHSLQKQGVALEPFVAQIASETIARSPRTAVYPVADASLVPQALLHNLKHNQVLHERNVVLTVRFVERPRVDDGARATIDRLDAGFWRVRLDFGFAETPDVPQALRACGAALPVPLDEASYFLSRETVVPRAAGRRVSGWRERLFATMSRNAGRVSEFFRLPDNAVIELGTRVQL
jgi:KUP system potassium uptake protein